MVAFGDICICEQVLKVENLPQPWVGDLKMAFIRCIVIVYLASFEAECCDKWQILAESSQPMPADFYVAQA